MALTKQALNLAFMGLDQKSDPFKISPGKFLSLVNTIPIKGGPTGILLQKRNGFSALPSLPNTANNFLTTFNGNLTALGTDILALNETSNNWVNKGDLQTIQLNTLPLVRSSTNQTQSDSAISGNLICTVYTDSVPVSGTPTNFFKYVIADSVTGQNIIAPVTISNATAHARVFVLGSYFVIMYPTNSSTHLSYIAVSILNPSLVTTQVDITTQYSAGDWDGVVANQNLYVAWNASDGGGAVRVTFIDQTLAQHGTVVFAGQVANLMSICADKTQAPAVIWIYYFTSSGSTSFVIAVSSALTTIVAPTSVPISGTYRNVTCSAQNNLASLFAEIENSYAFDASIPTDFIFSATADILGVVGALGTVALSVGLGSKAFIYNGDSYLTAIYQSDFQSTYFLLNVDAHTNTYTVVSKFAYTNSGGYATALPSVSISGTIASVSYILKDSIQAVNKSNSGVNIEAGIYAQTGVNLINFNFTSNNITSEIGNNLNLSGGFLWSYDGFQATENNFFLYPDLDLNADGTYHGLTTSTSGGFITAQQYFYVALYEWSDNQGNLFRSAPSIPVTITTTGTTSTNTIKVPTLRLTYKTDVKITLYRWSTAQQTYYEVTSISNPILNNKLVDFVTIVDTLADSSILGNAILYTTGSVIENVGPPATLSITLYKSRLFFVDAEDQNLLWFSKQVIESTPVEMSDLFTIYVAPTIGAQGNTGTITALSAMDDKLIIFKKDAIYYITGNGPDNTGANNDFSDPVFITSTVGCSNQNSIVFMPQGLMFQSDKGIWLLGRDLSTQYIGAPVENFNSTTVLSALTIPGTNQVRFTLNNNVILMYDYYFGVWGSFQGNFAISSTLYQSLHTFIDSFGRAFQESEGIYLDGTNPVLMNFTTGWINVAGLQGYERLYDVYILGTYFSPHKLIVSVAYDYASAPSQQSIISPNNFNANWGGSEVWGNPLGVPYPWGGTRQLEQWRIHTQRQTCQAFQVSIQEIYDPSYGVAAGAGLTLSNMNLRLGIKKSVRPIRAANSVG